MPATMKPIRVLQAERAKLSDAKSGLRDQAKALLARATAEGRVLTDAEKQQHGDLVARMAGIEEQVRLADDEIADAGKALERDRSAPVARTGEIEVVAEGFESDPKRGFKSPREFMHAVIANKNRAPHAAEDARLRFLAAAGSDEQSGISDGYGGFLVPEGFSPSLLTVPTEADPTIGRVLDMPMSAPSVKIPARTDKNHTSSVSGGLTVARSEETVAKTASRMAVEQIQFTAHSLFGLAYATEEILTDSPISFAAMLAAGFQDEFAARLLYEKLHGTGAGEFRGVISAPGTVTVSAEGGQSADTINGTNIVKMRARCWRYGEAIWLANHDTLPQLVAAHIALTNGSVPLFAPANGMDRPDTLLGRPIFFTEFASTLGDLGDLILGTWSQYIQATLQGVQSAESIHVRFVEHERAFKFWLRNDGQPWWRSALTPKKGSSTISPFVILAAR